MEKHWLDYITALGAIFTPISVLVITGIGWKFRKKIERKIELENKLREDRIQVYNLVLEPFVLLLMSDAAWEAEKANKGKDKNKIASNKLLSLDYRKNSFKLSLIASDSVVLAYNDLCQHFYSKNDSEHLSSANDIRITMGLLGNFLLEIRRSMGNEATKLNQWQMLEWFISDAKKWNN